MFSALFFFMLITLGVGSIVAYYTVIIEFAYNTLDGKILKSSLTASILLIGFLFGLASDLTKSTNQQKVRRRCCL